MQEIITYILVAAAIIGLFIRLRHSAKSKDKCSGCSGCSNYSGYSQHSGKSNRCCGNCK